jgi:hypothetical protein
MRNGHWSPSGAPGSRIMLIAVPLIIAMAVGLVLGLRLVSERDASPKLSSRGGGAASAAPPTPPNASASPTVTAGASATPPAAATATPSMSTGAADISCGIIVPADPLTGPGLAALYLLTGPGGMSPHVSGCTESNPKLDAFAQAAILDPLPGAGALTAAPSTLPSSRSSGQPAAQEPRARMHPKQPDKAAVRGAATPVMRGGTSRCSP